MLVNPGCPSHQSFSESHRHIKVGMNLISFLVVIHSVEEVKEVDGCPQCFRKQQIQKVANLMFS